MMVASIGLQFFNNYANNKKNKEIQECLRLGGINTKAGQQKLTQIEEKFTQQNLSLGGTADLLIVTIFLALVKEGLPDGLQNK